MKLFRHKVITKKYALKAAMYRRLARKQGMDLDFSEESLFEMFDFESIGAQGRSFDELKYHNGYAYGKWLRDLDVSQMVQDVRTGDFCKAEFLKTGLDRLHNVSALECVLVPTWFPFKRNKKIASVVEQPKFYHVRHRNNDFSIVRRDVYWDTGWKDPRQIEMAKECATWLQVTNMVMNGTRI